MLPSWVLSWFPFVLTSWLSVCLIQTWFVPDEYWQSLEVAHKLAFGYVCPREFVRDYNVWLLDLGMEGRYSLIYLSYGFRLTKSDFHVPGLGFIMAISKSYMQGTLSGLAHYYLCRIVARTYGRETAKWLAFHLLTSWFLVYIGSRTLLNTVETSLAEIVIALWLKDSRAAKAKPVMAILVLFSTYLRPTAAAFYLPMVVSEIITTYKKKSLAYLLSTVIPCIVVLVPLIAFDSFMYGRLCVPFWNFLKFNVVSNLSDMYGTHPWHWYLSSALPSVCGILLLPYGFLYSRPESRRIPLIRNRQTGLILMCAFSYVFFHSCVGHKEIRFLAPVVPPLCLLASHWARGLPEKKQKFLIAFTLICNIPLILYFGLRYQRGTLAVMDFLTQEARSDNTSILFLLPCHSTPFYSHIHSNVSMKFLTCEPNFSHLGNYTDEADNFFSNPEAWLLNELDKNNFSFTHIALFDPLRRTIGGILYLRNYTPVEAYFHTDLPEGRVGKYLFVYKRVRVE